MKNSIYRGPEWDPPIQPSFNLQPLLNSFLLGSTLYSSHLGLLVIVETHHACGYTNPSVKSFLCSPPVKILHLLQGATQLSPFWEAFTGSCRETDIHLPGCSQSACLCFPVAPTHQVGVSSQWICFLSWLWIVCRGHSCCLCAWHMASYTAALSEWAQNTHVNVQVASPLKMQSKPFTS